LDSREKRSPRPTPLPERSPPLLFDATPRPTPNGLAPFCRPPRTIPHRSDRPRYPLSRPWSMPCPPWTPTRADLHRPSPNPSPRHQPRVDLYDQFPEPPRP
jgi:hypothetical protein